MKATVIGSDTSGDEAPPVTISSPSDGETSAPRITQSDKDAFDSTMDKVLEGRTDTGGDDGAKVESGEPKIVPAPSRDPKMMKVIDPSKPSALSGKDPAKPPTTPKSKPDPEPPEAKSAPAASAPAIKPTTPPAPPAAPQAPADPEIDGIKKPQNLSPANDSNWETLRGLTKRYKQESTQARQIIENLQKETGKLPPEIEKDYNELKDMRRKFDLQNDPYFTENFDKPISGRNEEICKIMGQCGMPEEAIKEINSSGGPMSQPAKFWENGKDGVIDRLRASDNPQENAAAVIIRNMLDKNTEALYERTKQVQKAANGQADWMKERIAKIDSTRKTEQEFIASRLQQLQQQLPWAQERTEPENATPEQKAEVAAHNQFIKDSTDRLKIALNPRSPQEKLDVAVASVLAFRFKADLDTAEQKIAALNEQINKLKGASATAPQGRAAPSTKPQASSFSQLIKMKDADAVEQAMKEAGI